MISALVKKRGELAWLLSEAGKVQRRIAKHLAHVDRVLAMVGYENVPTAIRNRRKNAPSLFRRGQLRRIIYDIRREGPCITTDRQFALEVMNRLLWSQTYEAVYHDYATSKAQADAGEIFEQVCTDPNLATISDALDCAKEAIKSARETQRAEEDLYAQKQMASAAWWLLLITAFIGVVSIGITGIGTYFLLRTIRISAKANEVSREAGQVSLLKAKAID